MIYCATEFGKSVLAMTYSPVYTLQFTLYLCYKPLGILQRVTKGQKVHISSHDVFQKLHNIDSA